MEEGWSTPLTKLLNLRFPILQAPMAGQIAGAELVAAVSSAGALGMLPLWMTDPGDIPAAIERVRALTNGVFGVSLNLQWAQEDRLAAALEADAQLVHFFWGDPAPYMQAARTAGARVMLTVASAEEARRAVDQGVEILIA